MIVYTKDAAIEFSVSELESSPTLQQFLQSLSDNSKTPPEETNEQGGGTFSAPSKVSLTSAQPYVIPLARGQGLEGYLTLQHDDQVSSIGGNPNNLINSKKIPKNSEKSKNRVKNIFGNFSGIFRRIFHRDSERETASCVVVPSLSQDENICSAEVSVTLTEGRKRGRPRKATPSSESKRPRGRPRKHPVENVAPFSGEGSVAPVSDDDNIAPVSNQPQTEDNLPQPVLATPVDHDEDNFSTCSPDGMAYFEDDVPKGVELKRIERLTLGRNNDPLHLTAKQVWEIYKAYRLSIQDYGEFYRRLASGGNVAELFDDQLLAPIFRLSVSFGEVVRLLFTAIPHEPRRYSMFLKDWYSPLVDMYRIGVDCVSVSEAIRAQIKNPRFRLNCPRGLVTKAAEAMSRLVLLGHAEEVVRDRERLLKRVFGEDYEREKLRP